MIEENNCPELEQDIDWKNMNDLFFQYIFLFIKEYAKIVVEYLSDPKADIHQIV